MVKQFVSPDFDYHDFVCGMPRTGKTTKVLNDLKAYPGPVLFFNPQEEDTSFIRADGYNDIADIFKALKAGKKIDYVPSENDKEADVELRLIVKQLMERPPVEKMTLAVDECHIYVPEGVGEHPLFQVIRRGLKKGIKGTFISQRPADCSKKIITGCYRHSIFYTSGEGAYFRNKGIPADEVERIIAAGGLYSYAVWEGGRLSGPHRETV